MISRVKMWMLKKIDEAKRRGAKGRFVEKRFVGRKRGLKEYRFKEIDVEVKRVCLR
jgi:hypothetical protein